MSKNLNDMPGYIHADYKIVLNPHEDLRVKIVNIKKDFGENYKAPTALWGKPHIMLAKFTVWQMMEDRIVHRLKVSAMGMPPFKVLLKDYGSIPSHSIVINVASKLPIQHLVKELRTAKRLMKSPDHVPFFNIDPHLIIASKLLPAQYEKSWLEYSHKSFTGSFIADTMLLLKRNEGEKAYQIVKRLEFMNLPVSTTQGQLFP